MNNIRRIILLLIVGLAVGIFFAVQLKAPARTTSPVVSNLSLQEAYNVLEEDQLQLKDEIKNLKTSIEEKQDNLKQSNKVSQTLVSEAENLRAEAGLTSQKGRGVVITLADSPQGEATIDSIVHAADLRDLVNVLWKAGAESVSLNDQRLVATTSIDSIINTILINNIKVVNPFAVKAIGNHDDLAKSLEDSDILLDIMKRKKQNGLIFNHQFVSEVTIDPFVGGFAINHASVSEEND